MAEGPGNDVFLFQGVGDELLGEFSGLPVSDQPSDDVAAIDVEDHKECDRHRTPISPNGLTAGEYIARCAAEVVSLRPEDVGRYAHEVLLLAWKRELKARLEDVGDLLAKGDPADLLVALRYGPKIADDVARIIAEVRHDTTGAAH